jgi:hypothetical protein
MLGHTQRVAPAYCLAGPRKFRCHGGEKVVALQPLVLPAEEVAAP